MDDRSPPRRRTTRPSTADEVTPSWRSAADGGGQTGTSARASLPASPRASQTTRAGAPVPLRVSIPSAAPPLRRSTASTSAVASSTRSPLLHPQTPPPAASQALANPPMASFQFPAVPSLTTTAPSRGTMSPPPSGSAMGASSNHSPRPPRTSSNPPSPAVSSYSYSSGAGAGASGSLGQGSARRKPPPPLELTRRQPTWESADDARRVVRDHSADSSGVSGGEEGRSERYPSHEGTPARRQAPLLTTTPLQSERSFTGKSEERDTLSQLFSFRSSPLLDHPIPNSSLSLTPPPDSPPEADADEPGEDDTSHTNFSFLSSSPFDTGILSTSPSSPYGPPATRYGAARQHQIGLGLPFSMSAAANLSSLSPSGYSSNSVTPGPSSSRELYESQRSPSGERSRSRESRIESPVTDRSKLIGLGELATPRWTSGVLERRWGAPYTNSTARGKDGGLQERDEDEFDVLGSYGSMSELEPLPLTHAPLDASSPTVSSRPPIGASYSVPFPSSLVASASSMALINSTTMGLIDFKNEPAYFASGSPIDPTTRQRPEQLRRPSSTYSLDAVSITEELDEEPSELADERRDSEFEERDDVPRQYDPLANRRSAGAARSAPSSAVGMDWTVGAGGDPSIVGLGFDYDATNGGAAALAAAAAALDPSGRRVSGSSISSRRSSNSRPGSSDGKPRSTHLRRQSASKSGFAHLPPSPAASTAAHHPSLSAGPVPTLPGSTSQTPPHVTSSRSSEGARLSHHSSFHSHHSSPSIIAASILRQTRDPEFDGIDMDTVAAADSGTAEALRRLDGLSSPRVSKVLSGPGSAGARSRTMSRETGTAPAKDDGWSRRRARSSTGGSSSALAKDVESAMLHESIKSTAASSIKSGPPSSVGSPLPPFISPSTTSAPFGGASRSPVSPQMSRMPTTVPRPGSSSNYDVPFPSTSPFKRGSSSSTSITAGTSNSAAGSRDSTSGTSVSGSSFTNAARSASSKNRRGSVGSDMSSNPSVGDLSPHEAVEVGELSQSIPPVPPLPKDWEAYRPSTGGTSSSSTQNSPRFDPNRRPSDSSSFNDAALLSPRSADMEPSLSSGSTNKTPTRKWSISSAFKSKSPKPSNIKESTSYTDLVATAQRTRDSTASNYTSEQLYPRRMAASTNDIVGLASGTSSSSSRNSQDHESPGSRMRNTFRSDKTASTILSRTRTSSISSNSTTRTAMGSQTAGTPAAATPSVVTTSPGRSRSSLLSPRRTPSGIPFFSRKTSTGSVMKTPSPNPDKQEPELEEPRSSGPKSILGLNFLRSTASRRDKEKEKAPPSPTLLKRQTLSHVPPPREFEPRVDEFGRRASVAAKTTSLITRKRGKTLSSAEEAPTEAKSLNLPPMQMSALSATTVRRVDSLSSNSSTTSKTTAGSSRLQPPTKANKLQESVKANLPTIAGSPSTHTFPLVQDRQSPSDANMDATTPPPPPMSQTPTKIPRLFHRVNATSPRLSTRPSDSSLNRGHSPVTFASSSSAQPASRRLSHYSTAPDTSSMLSASISSANLFSETDPIMSDFGIVTRELGLASGEKTLSTRRRIDSEPSQIPRSRSTTNGTSLAAKPPVENLASSTSSRLSTTALPRANRRKSLMAGEDAKAAATLALERPRGAVAQPRMSLQAPRLSDSTSSTSSSTPANSGLPRRPASKTSEASTSASTSSSRRASAASIQSNVDPLASSRSSRTLASKMAIPSRISKSSNNPTLSASTTDSGSGRSSANSQYGVTEEQLRGDEEMAAYVRRQHAKKLAAGLSPEAIRKMFEFPDPTEPLPSLDSRDASSLYSRYLSEYEKEEIREYDKVYFVGPNCDKKMATKDNSTNNFGFDDERGDYLLVPHDHIRFRYEVIDVLGKGSFGQVLQCRDHKTGEMVAIKIIRNKKRFHHQALVEIKVLENLVKWDPDEKHYVIRMVDSFTFRGHLCIVTELLSINLYELVKANSFAGFTTTLIRRFTMQILGSLALLRHQRVVHCDLKPENILLKHPAKSAIKVIDFGSSCFENEKVYTYIQSRFYRSPEVILGMNYHMAIDMWSLGCIIAEMFTGYPIFPGENEQEQLACIMEVMGLPEKYLVDRSSRKRLFFDSTGAPRPVVNSKGRRRRPGTKTLAQVLKSDDELFVDFIAKCLTWDPDRRLKPEPALRHPWIIAARTMSPTIPSRTSRASTGGPGVGSSSSAGSSVASSNISSPRRKVGSTTSSTMSTPAHSHQHPTAGAATAPVTRVRTSSTATSVPRLTSKGSLGLPSNSARYSVKG